MVRTALKLLRGQLVHLAFFGLALEIGMVVSIQIAVAVAAYVVLALYLVGAATPVGERSFPAGWGARADWLRTAAGLARLRPRRRRARS